jgi:hypothetical protein
LPAATRGIAASKCYDILAGGWPDQTKGPLPFVLKVGDDWHMNETSINPQIEFHAADRQTKATSIHKKNLLNKSRERVCD